MTAPFPPKISAPASRALAGAGITSLATLARWTEADVRALHGMGPKAVGELRAALAEDGRTFLPATGNAASADAGAAAVDAYLAAAPSPQRQTLAALRTTLRSILPDADEGLKYGMPTFLIEGKGIAGYASFKNHCNYSPMSGSVLEEAGDAVAGYSTSKGSLRFGIDESLPVALVRQLVTLRLAELKSPTTAKGS